MYLQFNDKLKFYKACADDITAFHEHLGTTKPIYVLYQAGKQSGEPIIGLQGPKIEAAVKDLYSNVD